MKLTVTVKQAPLGSHQMIGKRFTFDESGFTFGRSTDNDLVLPDPDRYVSSRHAMVTFQHGVFSVHDQSSNGLFADHSSDAIGRGEPLALQNGTSLKAGEYLLEVGIEADAPQSAAESLGEDAGLMSDERPFLKAVASSPPPANARAGADGAVQEDVALELALRLGLHGMTQDKLRRMPESVTEVIRSCVVGVMDVLSSRRQVKHQLKMDTTQIQGEHNNALKFSSSADEAIERMFTKSDNGYLPPETALLEALQDISDHQIAMMSATMQVHQKVVERFAPAELEKDLRCNLKEGGLFSGKPRFWEEYTKHYQDIASAGSPTIHDDFVKEFSSAYNAQLLKLKNERGKVAP